MPQFLGSLTPDTLLSLAQEKGFVEMLNAAMEVPVE